ncbi:MAG: hypothetical protein SOI56_09570, partial [Eubacteriales bacterium]
SDNQAWEDDASDRRASGLGSTSNNQDWEDDAPYRRALASGAHYPINSNDLMRLARAPSVPGAHQIIKIGKDNAPYRRAFGFESTSNNQDWEDDAPSRRASGFGSASNNQD